MRTRSWTRAGRCTIMTPQPTSLTDTGLLPHGKFDSPEGLMSTEVMVTEPRWRAGAAVDHPSSRPQTGRLAIRRFFRATVRTACTMSMGYDPTNLAWLERGGVMAVAHVRGGGAFGKEWHHAGRKLTKPNTWKDFIACAEYLVQAGYTSPAKLAGKGGAPAGILIGRAITERPDLFAAAQIAVGCTDMLRFETTMNGPPNVPEFGTVADEGRCSAALLAMSTLHQIQDGAKYPARAAHARHQRPARRTVAVGESHRPPSSRHGQRQAGTVSRRLPRRPRHRLDAEQQRHEEQADVWSFLLWQFGDPEFQPH